MLIRNVCHIAQKYLIKFHFDEISLGFKINKHKCNFHYVVMPMITSHILKFVGLTKTQKSRYLKNETLFFLQTEKIINYTSRATLLQKMVSY